MREETVSSPSARQIILGYQIPSSLTIQEEDTHGSVLIKTNIRLIMFSSMKAGPHLSWTEKLDLELITTQTMSSCKQKLGQKLINVNQKRCLSRSCMFENVAKIVLKPSRQEQQKQYSPFSAIPNQNLEPKFEYKKLPNQQIC